MKSNSSNSNDPSLEKFDSLPRLARGLAFCTLLASIALGRPVKALSQTQDSHQAATASQTSGTASEDGIPISDALVIAKCGSCHARDEHGNMQRISWTRTTPEGWQNVLKRMILVKGVSLTAADARAIVKYLSASHGLAPEEAMPIRFIAERRIHEEASVPDNDSRKTCVKCHAFAIPLSWRRSREEWKQFVDSHAARYLFSPNDDAVALLERLAPLHSPEWQAWNARSSLPDLAGRWLVTATMPGRGKYYGEMQVDRTGDAEFTTRLNLISIRDGSKILRTGRSVVFGGYAWRGRSNGVGDPASSAAPDDLSSDAREVLWIAPDHSRAEGRCFWGQYEEFGFDVRLQRASAGPTLLAVDRSSLKMGSRANRVRVIGDSFPVEVKPADLDFGPGVKVRSIVSSTAVEIVAEVDVAADAQPGKRAVAFRNSALPDAIAVYDRVDYVKVTPDSAVAAFGDRTHPRGFLQFEAIGYQRGADGKLHTADDVELGPVDVAWSFQVFHAAEGSNSNFVGKVNASGLFIPASENPNANFDVWVIATARDENDQSGNPLVGKSYLVVTIPTYTFNGRKYVRDLDRWVDDGPA
jgi:quinohemoprotein amine dehydrogenase